MIERDVVKMLLRAGADVRKKNNADGRTVFDYARNNNNNEDMLKILEQHQQVSGIF